jgi:toxin CptA
VPILEIRLRSSRMLLVVLTLAHLGASAVLLAVPRFWWRVALGLVVLASYVHSWRRHVTMRGPGRITALRLSGAGLEILQGQEGAWLPVTVLDSSLVTPWLTVLHLKRQGRRGMLPLVLLPDMMLPEDFRRLRVWLRWGRTSGHGMDGAAML